jgi:moderate conductance mechanosensitive channel
MDIAPFRPPQRSSIAWLAMPWFDTDPEALRRACGGDPSWICQRVLDVSQNETTAEASDLLFGTVGHILLVLVLAWLLNMFVRRSIRRFTAGMTGVTSTDTLRRLKRRAPSMMVDSSMLSTRAAARAKTLGDVLQSVASFMIWSVAGVTVLGELGIDLGPLVASAGIAGVALGFGAQSLVKDVIAGFFMLVEDQYGVGDIIDVGEASGTVEAVSLRTTRIRDVKGTVWHVPNGIVQRVGNMSQQWARALLDLNVAYGTDIDLAQRVIKDTADGLYGDADWSDAILEPPEVWGVEQLAPEAIHVRLVVKTKPAEQFRVMRELRARLIKAFEAQDIEMVNGPRALLVHEADDDHESDRRA